jgi:hypothetical protein
MTNVTTRDQIDVNSAIEKVDVCIIVCKGGPGKACLFMTNFIGASDFDSDSSTRRGSGVNIGSRLL